MPVILYLPSEWPETESSLAELPGVKKSGILIEKSDTALATGFESLKTASASVWICRLDSAFSGSGPFIANPLSLNDRTYYPDLPRPHPFKEIAGLSCASVSGDHYTRHGVASAIFDGCGLFAQTAAKHLAPNRWFCFGASGPEELRAIIEWCPILKSPEIESSSLILVTKICDRLELTVSMQHQIRDSVLGLVRLGANPTRILEHWMKVEKQNRKHLFHKMMKDFEAAAEGRAL